VIELLKNKYYSMIALDINMPSVSGIELLPQIVSSYPEIPVVMITAINDVDSAVRCIKEGAFDYVVKPVNETKLISIIKRGLELLDDRRSAAAAAATAASSAVIRPRRTLSITSE